MERVKLLDGVELRVASGRWPAGQTGTVVKVFENGVLVEIADGDGRTLELLSLPYEAVAPIPQPQQERFLVP
jgi:hypothetical protein